MPYKDKEIQRAYDKKRDRRAYDKARYHNNEKRREAQKAYARARWLRLTPEQRREELRRYPCRSPIGRRKEHLKARYRLTLEQWEALFESQGRCCAICQNPDPGWKRGWHTDHDHETNKVRGILCHLCNRTLGHAKDNIDWFLAFVAYLQGYDADLQARACLEPR
jgi:hypothetical protein